MRTAFLAAAALVPWAGGALKSLTGMEGGMGAADMAGSVGGRTPRADSAAASSA